MDPADVATTLMEDEDDVVLEAYEKAAHAEAAMGEAEAVPGDDSDVPLDVKESAGGAGGENGAANRTENRTENGIEDGARGEAPEGGYEHGVDVHVEGAEGAGIGPQPPHKQRSLTPQEEAAMAEASLDAGPEEEFEQESSPHTHASVKSLFKNFVSKDFQYDDSAPLQAIDRTPSIMGFDQDLDVQVKELSTELVWATENARYGSQMDALQQLDHTAMGNNEKIVNQIVDSCLPTLLELISSADVSDDAQKLALQILNSVCSHSYGRSKFRDVGGAKAIAKTVKLPLTDELIALLFSVIGRLCTNSWKNVMRLLEQEAVEPLVSLMNTKNADVRFHACAAMWNMTSYRGVFLESLESFGLLHVLVNILSEEEAEERVMWQAAGALRNFVVNNTVTQSAFAHQGGVDCVIQLLINLNSYSERVQKLVCGILTAGGVSQAVKDVFREKGGFNVFVGLAPSFSDAQLSRMSLVLARLCEKHHDNGKVVLDLGLLEKMLSVVLDRESSARLHCAIGVWGITLHNDDVLIRLSERGFFQRLVNMFLVEPDDVAVVLFPLVTNMLGVEYNKKWLHESGLFPVLVDFLRSNNAALLEVACTAIGAACRDCEELVQDLDACDGFRLVCHLLPSIHSGVGEASTRTLLTLLEHPCTHVPLMDMIHGLESYKPLVEMVKQLQRLQLTINASLLCGKLVLISVSAREKLIEHGIAHAIGHVLAHAKSNKVLGSVCDLIAAYSSRYRPIQSLLIDEDVIPAIFQLLDEDISTARLRVKCVNALWGMGIQCHRARIMIAVNNGVDVLAEMLLRTEKKEKLLHTALLRCIASVCSQDPINQSSCVKAGVAPIIVRTLLKLLIPPLSHTLEEPSVFSDATKGAEGADEEDVMISLEGEAATSSAESEKEESERAHDEEGVEVDVPPDIAARESEPAAGKSLQGPDSFSEQELKTLEYGLLAVWSLTLSSELGGTSFREHGIVPVLVKALQEFGVTPKQAVTFEKYRSVLMNAVGATGAFVACDYRTGRGGTNSRAIKERGVEDVVEELCGCSDPDIAKEAQKLLSYLPKDS